MQYCDNELRSLKNVKISLNYFSREKGIYQFNYVRFPIIFDSKYEAVTFFNSVPIYKYF